MASDRALIIGGSGRIGSSVARDLQRYTRAEIIVTGRRQPSELVPDTEFWQLDLDDRDSLRRAIAACQLVIHCAGPFHHRDGRVLATCIELGVNYLDVSDCRSFAQLSEAYKQSAIAAGVTAILHTGVFPGISNSMVRQAIEGLDRAESVRLSYAVGGSGGAGITVMRTTFLGLQTPFSALIEGEWRTVSPYSDREEITFPKPLGKTGVYWFDVAETYTLARSFPVQTVITKFGSVPDLYNRLTAAVSRFPAAWLHNPKFIEFLAQGSYTMTQFSDRFSGIGIGIQVEVSGDRNGERECDRSLFASHDTAAAAGCGTGIVAQYLLAGDLVKPGVWAVEEALSSDLFRAGLQQRGLSIQTVRSPANTN